MEIETGHVVSDVDPQRIWLEFADQREKATTWRRDNDGTPSNMSKEQYYFNQGFKKGAEYALQKRS